MSRRDSHLQQTAVDVGMMWDLEERPSDADSNTVELPEVSRPIAREETLTVS